MRRTLGWCVLAIAVVLAPARAGDEAADKLLQQARANWRKEAFDEAAAAYRALRDGFPAHGFVASGDAQFWLAACLDRAGKTEAAVVEMKTFLEKYPAHVSHEYMLLFLGHAYRKLGQEELARATWAEQLKQFPQGELAEHARGALGAAEGGGGADGAGGRPKAVADRGAADPATDFLDGALGAARWLARVGEPRGEGVAWAEYEGTKAHPLSLYEGAAGIGLYFLNLSAVTRDVSWLALANKAARFLEDRATHGDRGPSWSDEYEDDDGRIQSRDSSVALYVGSAGIGTFLLAVPQQGVSDIDPASRVGDAILKADQPWRDDTDIIAGAAGVGYFLLEMHRVTGSRKYLDGATRAADWLSAQAVKDEHGLKWKSSAKLERFYTGFSHGTAGVAAFLAKTYEVTHEKRFLEAAEAGAEWLLAQAAHDGAGLKWCHYRPDHADKFMTGWCHGPAGTCRFFLELHRITGKAEYLAAARAGAEWLMATLDPAAPSPGFWGNSMCCGAAGVGDFFLDLFLAQPEDRYLEYAARVGRYLLAHAKADGDGLKWTNCDAPDKNGKTYYGTGHMIGAAGIGTFLLRLACVCKGREALVVPTPDKPRWEPQRQVPDGGAYVVLTNLPETDPYFAAARRLADYRKGLIIPVHLDELAPVQRRLVQLRARYVALVLKPEDIDVNLHRRVLALSAGLDDDPFCDFAFGYITGPTAADALRLVEGAIRVEQQGLPKSVAETGVISGMPSRTLDTCGIPMLRDLGWAGRTIDWSCVEDDPHVREFVTAHLPEVAGRGVVEFGGNGDPEGIWLFHDARNSDRTKHWPFDPAQVGQDPKGEMPRILASAFRGLDLSPAVVWSGTCHSGVLVRAYVEDDIVSTFGRVDKVTEYRIPAGRALGLAILAAGPSAFLAPIGPNHGYATFVELYRAVATGMPLGDVMRSRYNEIVLAQGGPPRLPLYRAGAAPPREDPMRGGGANRLLYGDPLYRPFPAAGRSAIKTVGQWRTQGEPRTITCEVVDESSGVFWDMFGGDARFPERVYATVELPEDRARVETVTAQAKSPDGADVPLRPACLWAVEELDGKHVLHVQANGARDTLGRTGTVVRFQVGCRE